MSRTCLFTISTLSLSAVFLLLGLLFVARPDLGAGIYGVQAHDPATIVYVRAVGFRDLALAAYLFGLAAAGQIRALTIVLAATIVIPVGDIALLLRSGTGHAVHYMLHGASLFCFAAMALWSHGISRRRSP